MAGERGYEGTSIGAVSALCGLPASSIYSLAAADGLFVAQELDDDGVDLLQLLRLHADVMATLATRLADEEESGR